MNRNIKKLLLIPVKVLGWENYFPLLVISPWFSYSGDISSTVERVGRNIPAFEEPFLREGL